jgi:hypothetical protein
MQITYPINSGLSSGLLWSGSQITAFVLVILVDGPLSEDTITGGHDLEAGMWLLFGCLAAAACLSWLWTGRYAPLKQDKHHRECIRKNAPLNQDKHHRDKHQRMHQK